MATPNEPAHGPPEHPGDSEDEHLARPWVTAVLGLGVLGYTWYWLDDPSVRGLGRIFRWLYKTTGKWPIAIVLAAGGLALLTMGLSDIYGRYARRR